ncbi:MAG: hypothetical protein IIA67_13795, partial [Planctomycetes bacterium]|nr:hypothetical protein [Planctomycetota bacterium]
MRRRLWNRTRAGLRAGFGQLESWAGGLRGDAAPTSKLRATGRPALRAEPLEARLMLAADAPFLEVMPDPRNVALSDISIQFDQPVSGFGIDDLIFTHADSEGVREIVLPLSGAQLNTADNRSFSLTNLGPLTAAEGDYHLILDVLNAGINPLSVDDFGLSLGPELIANGEFDRADQLDGWLVSNVNGVHWELAQVPDDPDDGVARITSNHPDINPDNLLDPSIPLGANDANIQQEIGVSSNTTYQIEFDLITQKVIEQSGTRVDLHIYEGAGTGGFELVFERFFAGGGEQKSFEFTTRADATITIQFIADRSYRDFTVDNISLRRPVLGPSVDWTMDTTGPTASILPVDRDPSSVPLERITIAFDDDVEGLQLSDLSLFRDRGQGAGLEPLPLAGTSISPIDGRTYSLRGLTSLTGVHATYTLRLGAAGSQIRDLAGNPIVAGAEQSWTIDRIVPQSTVAVQITEAISPELNGSVDDPQAGVSVRLIGFNYPANDFEAINHGNGFWTLPAGTIDPVLTLDGAYDVRVTAIDVAGNIGIVTTPAALTLDRVPVVTVDRLVTNDTTPRLSGTVDDPAATVD